LSLVVAQEAPTTTSILLIWTPRQRQLGVTMVGHMALREGTRTQVLALGLLAMAGGQDSLKTRIASSTMGMVESATTLTEGSEAAAVLTTAAVEEVDTLVGVQSTAAARAVVDHSTLARTNRTQLDRRSRRATQDTVTLP